MLDKNLYTYKFKVSRVVDGDTVYGICDMGQGISRKMKVRLHGLNAPETRGSERVEGLKSKAWIRSKLKEAKQVYLETIKTKKGEDKQGKYGRYVGVFFADEINLNDLMILEGFAVAWNY